MRVMPDHSQTESKSLDKEEISRFEAMAKEWWDPRGKFKPLHKFNPTRLSYIREKTINHFDLDFNAHKPFTGLRILDIGCGGGLLCEPMARLGADIVGADPGFANIATARIHAQQQGLNIDYRCQSAEELYNAGETFDVVLNMEVIEHVLDVESFMQACCGMVRPNGLLFLATLNRTTKSYAMAIIGAEHILRWLPKGTHDWKKFITPDEVASLLLKGDLEIADQTGVTFNPLRDKWSLSTDMAVNYMILASKREHLS